MKVPLSKFWKQFLALNKNHFSAPTVPSYGNPSGNLGNTTVGNYGNAETGGYTPSGGLVTQNSGEAVS